MNTIKSLLALTAVSSLLTACSQGNSAPPVVQSVNPGSPSYSKLLFAVGTARIATTSGGSVTTAINIISTLRQPNGLSADLVDTPSISGPWTLPPPVPGLGDGVDAYATIQDGGPSLSDFGTNTITGTPQTVHLGAPPCDTSGVAPGGFSTCPSGTTANTSTFGQSGAVLGMGLQPGNATTNTTAYSYKPYAQPIFATTEQAGNAFTVPAGVQFKPWGGPPAFDDSNNGMGTRDGLHNLGAGLLGWNTGINVIMLASTPGASGKTPYLMSVSVPTGVNGSGQSSFATVTASANLNPGKLLPQITAPAFTEDGKGGGTIAVVLPPGATEGYVTITDIGPSTSGSSGLTGGANCQGVLGTGAAPVYYTIFVNASGTYSLPDTIGPNTTQTGPSSLTPSMSLCTSAANSAALNAPSTPGDTYAIQFFAMDYPLHELSYPMSKSQSPTLVGASGQADITISAPSAPLTY